METQHIDIATQDQLEVYGAREHNLKNIDVSFPRNQLVVITGLSGSGKSSLAFDTIYAEGQRRYMETLSAYSRRFIGNMERPDVDEVLGLSPVIAIEQKTTSRNPRSTVGTITEVYDFLRLLYARVADAYSYNTGELMQKMSEEQIVNEILLRFNKQQITVLAPLVMGRKGEYRDLFEQLAKQGYTKALVDGEIVNIQPGLQLDRYKIHDIDAVIDRGVEASEPEKIRIEHSVATAIKMARGTVRVMDAKKKVHLFSKFLMCPSTGISYAEPQPNTFSFNSAYGWCSECEGLGYVSKISLEEVIPDPELSISMGGLAPLGQHRDNWDYRILTGLAKKHNFSLSEPIKNLSPEILDMILYAQDEKVSVVLSTGIKVVDDMSYEGLITKMEREFKEGIGLRFADFQEQCVCPTCGGARLKKEALFFTIGGKNIYELSCMDIKSLYGWFQDVNSFLSERQVVIAVEIVKEIQARLGFLMDVGLDYISLERSARTLSGGEAQRIRLATQIGSQLTNVLYILDEPSIGLHQSDNDKLISALKKLRDIGNSVLVVEHDKDMIMQADYVLDMGPNAGIHAGRVMAQGTPKEIMNFSTHTTDYLSGRKAIQEPEEYRAGNGKQLILGGARGNTLKNLTVSFPLGKMIAVTGVSGSGKSTLIGETLYPILNHHFFRAKQKPLAYDTIEGLEHIDKVIEIDQTPIGRTPRSNPATYTKIFDAVRDLFAMLPESKMRGYKVGRFSFNVKGGRCEACQGAGLKTIDMNPLPDVLVQCDECQGRRYDRETLEVRYKGKSISDVLDMSVEEAVTFFENIPAISRKVKTMLDVGLGYITLGQASTTLSGGEAQRIKLASELSKRDTGKTFYILDEPSTGLHFEDIRVLLDVLNKLANKGNTVLIIEHNLDIIKTADYAIDLGPKGGSEGGHIVFAGTPKELCGCEDSLTGIYLRRELLK